MNKPIQILLADDDEVDRDLFLEAFSEMKVRSIVQTMNNGIELMDYLTDSNSKIPDIIFLDLNMPLKNGMECLKEIKSNNRLKDIAVAIYSTSDNEKDIDETFLKGANVYITKPSNFIKLKQVLEKAVMTAYHYNHQSMNRDNFILRI